MSVQKQQSDSGNDSQTVEDFCDEFSAVEGYDLEQPYFNQPDVWVGEDSIVMLSHVENDSVGTIDLSDMVVAEQTYVGRVRKDDTPVCVAHSHGYEHTVALSYLNRVAEVFDKSLGDMRVWQAKEVEFPIVVEFADSDGEYNSDYIAVIAPRRVSMLTGVEKSHDLDNN